MVTEVAICSTEANIVTIYNIAHTVSRVPHYPFIYQLSFTAPCFSMTY